LLSALSGIESLDISDEAWRGVEKKQSLPALEPSQNKYTIRGRKRLKVFVCLRYLLYDKY
ncbi:MAG TPA: hypothetical protein P5249_01890, partial [Smithellaceae bacterium]|nr:hypothetical protein [Smithellaceae bacterium]